MEYLMSSERENTAEVENADNAATKSTIIERAINYATGNQREVTAWGLFTLLFAYVGAEILPIMPKYAPDAGVVGAICTALISLLAAGQNQNGTHGGRK